MMHINLDNVGFRKGLFLSFVLGFFVRLIPEVLSFPHPIGFDTIFYAWRIRDGVVLYHWTSFFSSWWLSFAFLTPFHKVLQVDPFLLLKLTAPLLYGLNTCGVCFFAMKALSWKPKKGLFAALLFSLQMAALRISWDLCRNMLGLGVLLFALPSIKSGVNSMRQLLFVFLLSLVIVFSHELVSVVLFVAVLGIALRGLLDGAKGSSLKALMAASPALLLFLANVYFVVFPVPHVAETNVLEVGQPLGHYEGSLFFFTNYLTVCDVVQYYPTYLALFSHVLLLFAMLYVAVLPLVLAGFFRDRVLDGWTALLLVGSFWALITPFFALDMWSRWMLMLVYPFTFYAVNGIAKALHSGGNSVGPAFRLLSWMKMSKKAVKLLLVLSFSHGLVFMATPLFFGRAGVFGIPTTVSYVPSTMQSNSLPLVDVDDSVKTIKWLDMQMNSSSVLLVQEAFFWWANLYLDNRPIILRFNSDLEGAINVALELGVSHVYFVWWNENIGWYDLSVPNCFDVVFSSGRISAFEYHG